MGKINYDTIALDYEKTRDIEDKVYKSIINILDPQKNDCIMEYGCGTGNYLFAMSNSFTVRQFAGIEKSTNMANIAKQKVPAANIKIGSYQDHVFPDNSFNKIFCIDTIHHIFDLSSFFSEIYSLLTKDGIFIICTETPRQLKQKYWNTYFPSLYHADRNRFPTINRILNTSRKTGLVCEYIFSIQEEKKSVISDAMIKRIKNKTLSALYLISENEYKAGKKKMEQDYHEKRIINQKEGYTFIVFRKENDI